MHAEVNVTTSQCSNCRFTHCITHPIIIITYIYIICICQNKICKYNHWFEKGERKKSWCGQAEKVCVVSIHSAVRNSRKPKDAKQTSDVKKTNDDLPRSKKRFIIICVTRRHIILHVASSYICVMLYIGQDGRRDEDVGCPSRILYTLAYIVYLYLYI